jgi:hypothetical protein
MLEQSLIFHCSPTLAGIKTGSLFSCRFASADEFLSELCDLNQTLSDRGIRIEVLRVKSSRALVLAYRPKRLATDLNKSGVWRFLNQFGYAENDPERAISRLKARFAPQAGFPHEIGLFLGYPLADVADFIKNRGRNSKCTGCWKVYRDEGEAARLFRRYEKCKEVYLQMFGKGCSVLQLTVAV